MPLVAYAAATVVAGTALVLAPIDPKPLRDLLADLDAPAPTPDPEPVPMFNESLISHVRTALGLRHWRPNAGHGETETRIVLWSQLELNDLFEQTGGTVTSQMVEVTSSGITWTEEEITVTVDVPGVGPVQIVTGWCDDLAKYGSREELPLMRALVATQPEILETVPARGQLLGYDRLAITPGAPLPGGRTVATVEDPLGSAWRVTDDQGRVHYLHKYGQLLRYTTGVVTLVEPEWAGWSAD